MTSSGAVLGVGRLLSLEVLDPSTGRTRTIRPSKRWLGWAVGKKSYCICRVLKPAKIQKLPAAILAAHRKFHQAPSRGAMMVDVPSPAGKLAQVGLVKALVYDVPRSIRSPGKNPYHWHHAFGDTGHKGGDSYPTKLLPALMRDSNGNLFIKRRPGNIFTVDTWLRG